MTAAVTHVMRAPIVGGSELETLAITRRLAAFRHQVLFPRRFEAWEPSIRDRFPEGTTVEGVDDLEERLASLRSGLVHVQFPFLIHPAAPHHDSVLVFRGLHDRLAVPVVFTVHAAVNVPVLPHIHYVFHTEEQAARFGRAIERERITICPSLVEVPDQAPARSRDGAVRILWVSRNEAGKFHPDVAAIVGEVLEACPEARFRFVGMPPDGWPHAGERSDGARTPLRRRGPRCDARPGAARERGLGRSRPAVVRRRARRARPRSPGEARDGRRRDPARAGIPGAGGAGVERALFAAVAGGRP
jgi:hypothetical protein